MDMAALEELLQGSGDTWFDRWIWWQASPEVRQRLDEYERALILRLGQLILARIARTSFVSAPHTMPWAAVLRLTTRGVAA